MKYREVSIALEKKKYNAGRYVIRTDVDCADELRSFITDKQFSDLDPDFEKDIVYRRHRKFEFPLPFGENKDAIMKISWPSPKYKWHRRLQLIIKQRFFEDYCETAYYGALALEDAGIATHKVLGFWTENISAMRTDSYLLYEKVEADCNGHELMLKCHGGEGSEKDRQRFDEFLTAMAKIVRKLHNVNLRHGDIADHNFLVRFDAPDEEFNSPHTLFMIDTDCVGESVGLTAGRRLRNNIRDWRIIDLDETRLKKVIKTYLGDEYKEKWWKLLCYYRSPWYRPIRSIRYILKGKALKDPYHIN